MPSPAEHTHNGLIQLRHQGQSIWRDGLSRPEIHSGELANSISNDRLSGVCVSLGAFQRFLAGSTEYDTAIRALARQERNAEQILEALLVEDVRMAADQLRPLYDLTEGHDGYVCFPLSPFVFENGEEIIAESERIYSAIGRKNAMISIPATESGIAALEHLLARGISVHAFGILTLESYRQAVEAYMSGIERVVRRGGGLNHISSVAGISISAIDQAVSDRLRNLLGTSIDEQQRATAENAEGKAAIATAKAIYSAYLEFFSQEDSRWKMLVAKGARPQRVIWSNTGGDPNDRKTLYVEALIGKDTIASLHASQIADLRQREIAHGMLEAKSNEIIGLHEELLQLNLSMIETMQSYRKRMISDLEQSMDDIVDVIAEKSRSERSMV